METTAPRASRYEEIAADECWRLLRTAPIGRLVWTGEHGLSVATMNFAVEDDEILLQTLPYGAVARECRDRAVAFQADHVDEDTRTGWSVLVRGRATFDLDGGTPPDAVDVWPEGSRVLRLLLTPRLVTGRRLVPATVGRPRT